nr:leucine-rich repeat domain-containing protein [Lachnospiraceae bacterium]
DGSYIMEWFDQDEEDDSEPYIWMIEFYDDDYSYSGSSMEKYNGNLVSSLSAGTTYYFLATTYDEMETANYKIRLRKDAMEVTDSIKIYMEPGNTVTACMDDAIKGEADSISYQWSQWDEDADEGEGDYVEISGATASTYSFIPNQEETILKCDIFEDGFAHSTRFYIYSVDFILEYEESFNLQYGETANMTITCDTFETGEEVTFKWYLKEFNYEGTTAIVNRTLVSENSVPVTPGQAGEFGKAKDSLAIEAKGWFSYECEVTQGENVKVATFDVYGSSMNVTCDKWLYHGSLGQPITLSVKPWMRNGDTSVTFSYQWEVFVMEDGKAVVFDESDSVVSGLDKSGVTITPDRVSTFYTSCKITASTGETRTLSFNLEVGRSICLNSPSTNVLTCDIGKEILLTVDAGTIGGEVYYKWYKGRVNEKTQIADANGSSIHVTLSSPVEEYYCVLSDRYKDKSEVYFAVMDPSKAVKAGSKESAPVIKTGENKLVSLPEGDMYNYVKFVPEESGKYIIYSNGDLYFEGYLLDETGKVIDESQMLSYVMTYEEALQLGLWGPNFAIIRELEAGKTYYIQTGFDYDDHESALYPVIVKNMNKMTEPAQEPSGGKTEPVHTHTPVKIAAKESTVDAEGNIEYWKCSGCSKLFADSACTKEIQSSDTITPKKKAEASQTIDPKTGAKNAAGVPEDKGSMLTDEKTNAKVKVVSQKGKTPAVSFTGLAYQKAKNVKVNDTVQINGVKYQVTSVAAGAFDGSKAENVTLGKNIKTLSPGAFKGSKVKTITIKSTKLTKKSVKNALKGCKSGKVTIKVKVGNKKKNKQYVTKYKKYFTKKNVGKKVTIK